MAKKGKKYVEAAKLVEKGKAYSIDEAVALVKKTSITKFDAGVDVAFKLNLDTRHADQQLRGAIGLPNGTGKDKRVLVIAEGAKAEEAKAAGALILTYGEVLNAILYFFIISFVLFMVVKFINKGKKKEEQEEETKTKECPYCLSKIPEQATRCSHCTSILDEKK